MGFVAYLLVYFDIGFQWLYCLPYKYTFTARMPHILYTKTNSNRIARNGDRGSDDGGGGGDDGSFCMEIMKLQ